MIVLAPAGPAGPRQAQGQELGEVGPFVLERFSELTWPGVYLPAFSLVPERRWVHRFTLRTREAPWGLLAIDAVGVESSRDPELRQRTVGVPSLEGAGNLWLGARFTPARGDLSMTLGRPLSVVRGQNQAPRVGWSGPARLSVQGRF